MSRSRTKNRTNTPAVLGRRVRDLFPPKLIPTAHVSSAKFANQSFGLRRASTVSFLNVKSRRVSGGRPVRTGAAAARRPVDAPRP